MVENTRNERGGRWQLHSASLADTCEKNYKQYYNLRYDVVLYLMVIIIARLYVADRKNRTSRKGSNLTVGCQER